MRRNTMMEEYKMNELLKVMVDDNEFDKMIEQKKALRNVLREYIKMKGEEFNLDDHFVNDVLYQMSNL